MTAALAMPMNVVLRVRFANFEPTSAAASAMPIFGPHSGAMTMAPTVMATLARKRPIATTNADRTTNKTNVRPPDETLSISSFNSSRYIRFAPLFLWFCSFPISGRLCDTSSKPVPEHSKWPRDVVHGHQQ